MQIVQRLAAVFLIAIGLVVAAHFVFEPFYRGLTDTGQVWRILDWIMAPAVLILVAARWHEKRQLDLLGPNGGFNLPTRGRQRRLLNRHLFDPVVFLELVRQPDGRRRAARHAPND